MEISTDILSLNGILASAKSKYGDMSKIIYKGLGGEDAIFYIEECLKKFLKTKNYLEEDVPKPEFQSYFEELSLLFLMNCEFAKPFEIQEYEHLACNFPKLSKYLIAKVFVDMHMVEYFCAALEKLPMKYSSEIFTVFPPILDKQDPDKLFEDTHFILCTIANIVSKNQELKYTDDMDVLLRNVPDFFFYVTRVPKNDATKLRENILYKRAGFVLEKLFNLMFFCHQNDMLDGIFIDKLIESTTSIVKAITLDMFLYWAEIDLPNGTLQSLVAESAYLIHEKYQHHRPAMELVNSLKPFAAKPKDIKEQLHSADLNRMVYMVNKADENQKKWFAALIFSSFFSDKDAMKCVDKWAHLCSEEDVSRLLNQSVKVKEQEPKKLALKCASLLNLERLIVVAIRHFYNNGFVVLNDNQNELISWFNKLKDSDSVSQEVSRDLLFFILENPDFAIHFILSECLKSDFYISSLYDTFIKLKDVWRIHDICLNNLSKLMRNKPPTAETSQSYRKLIQTFFVMNLMTFEVFSGRIVCSFLEEHMKENKYEEMKQLLVIINNLELSIKVGDGTKKFFQILFEIIRRRRDIADFDASFQNLVQESIHLILNKTIPNIQLGASYFAENDDDIPKNYRRNYYKLFLCSHIDQTLLQYLIGNLPTDNTARTVQLMRVLPTSIQEEWIIICSEASEKVGSIQLVKILRDIMILNSDYVRSQRSKGDYYAVTVEWLRYLVQQYGYILKIKFLPLNNDEIEILITESLVSLLSHLPEELKESEGLNIIHSLMTTKSLKHLGNDPNFVNNICRIRNTSLCQVIASRILQ